MSTNHQGFTLLEVVIALAILAVSVMILIETQAGALLMSTDADRMSTATMLAQEKMIEAHLVLEREGWGSQDIEEEGDFDDFGEEDFRGDAMRIEIDSDQYEDFHWAYTIRKIDLEIPTDLGGMASELSDGGYFGEQEQENSSLSDQQMDLSDLGISTEMITEYLGDYIREVRVLVWWGDNEDGVDQVELLTHIINPSGVVSTEEDEE